MAWRLGVSESSLLAYFAANGGAPDGADHGNDLVAALIDQRLASRALPASCDTVERPAPWVKRDRPRYFIPG